jgi:hypothetical protein
MESPGYYRIELRALGEAGAHGAPSIDPRAEFHHTAGRPYRVGSGTSIFNGPVTCVTR